MAWKISVFWNELGKAALISVAQAPSTTVDATWQVPESFVPQKQFRLPSEMQFVRRMQVTTF